MVWIDHSTFLPLSNTTTRFTCLHTCCFKASPHGRTNIYIHLPAVSGAAIRWPRYNCSHMCHIPRVPLGSPVCTFAVSHGRHTVVLARLFTHVPVPAPRGGRVYSPLCCVPVPRCGRAVMPPGCISILCVAWVRLFTNFPRPVLPHGCLDTPAMS